MRVSGNILDRLVIRILPICVTFSLVFYLTSDKEPSQLIKPFIGTVLILWLFDSLVILSKGIKRLSIHDARIQFGQDKILSEDILSIVPRKDNRRGIDIKTIEIEYLKDGLSKRQRTITKPTFLDLFGKKFRTIDLLVEQFPNLRDKVMEETED